MSQGNVRDIREILASIEALNAQADDVSRENRSPVRGQSELPRSMVAEMAEHQADIVLLDDIHRKGGTAGERVLKVPADDQMTVSDTGKDASPDTEFDQMLSALMKDIGRDEGRPLTAAKQETPDLSADGGRFAPSVGGDSDSLTELKADIDDLLSPYLDVPPAHSEASRQAEQHSRTFTDTARQPSGERKTADPEVKPAAGRLKPGEGPVAGNQLLSDIMTDQMRAQIAEFVLAEIKQQISVWIAQNLDKIVEDALRSLPTESRDASRTRSAG